MNSDEMPAQALPQKSIVPYENFANLFVAWLFFFLAVLGASFIHIVLFMIVWISSISNPIGSLSLIRSISNYGILLTIAMMAGKVIASAAWELSCRRGKNLVFLGFFQPVVIIIACVSFNSDNRCAYLASTAGFLPAAWVILKRFNLIQ